MDDTGPYAAASRDGVFVVDTVELTPRLRITFAVAGVEYEAGVDVEGLKLDGLPAMALPCDVIDTYDAIKGFTMSNIPVGGLLRISTRTARRDSKSVRENAHTDAPGSVGHHESRPHVRMSNYRIWDACLASGLSPSSRLSSAYSQ